MTQMVEVREENLLIRVTSEACRKTLTIVVQGEYTPITNCDL